MFGQAPTQPSRVESDRVVVDVATRTTVPHSSWVAYKLVLRRCLNLAEYVLMEARCLFVFIAINVMVYNEIF